MQTEGRKNYLVVDFNQIKPQMCLLGEYFVSKFQESNSKLLKYLQDLSSAKSLLTHLILWRNSLLLVFIKLIGCVWEAPLFDMAEWYIEKKILPARRAKKFFCLDIFTHRFLSKFWDVNYFSFSALSRKRIDVRVMLGVYVVMGVGIILAFMTLIAEILWFNKRFELLD